MSSNCNNDSESPRDPRIHRPTGIPSVSRPTISTAQGSVDSSQSEDANIGKRGPFKMLKKTAYHFLSKSSDVRVSRFPLAHRDTGDMKIDNTGTHLTGNNAILPVVDSGHLESKYHEDRTTMDNRVSSSAKSTLRGPSILEVGKVISGSNAPLPACARKPDPRLIMTSLKSILGTEHDVGKYLDINHLLALHQLDQDDFEDRDRIRAQLTQHRKPNISEGKNGTTVLGEPIRRSSIYSSTSVVLAGREHELPIIVVNTVEELYRTGNGIYQPNLFRTLPNRARLLELIHIYDSEESQGLADDPLASRFGLNASLHLETTPDVCALLATYISSLPEPILPPMFFRPIWDWCGLDDNHVEPNLRGQLRLSHIPLARTYTSPTESARILVAQLLLQLLPSPNFSLLIYLLAFFSQAALVNEENGVDVSDLSKMFGVRLFGEDPEVEYASAFRPRRDGEAMMNWFLRRWGPLSEGIFEVVEDAQMGLFRRPLARRDSFGKEILPNWLPAVGSNSSQSSADRHPDGNSILASPGSHTPGMTGSPAYPLSCDLLETITTHSTPKLPGKESSIVSLLSRTLGDQDFGVILPPSSDVGINETLDLRPEMNHDDGLSTAALDQRLLDMSIPILLDETMSGVYSIPNTTTYTSRETQTSPVHSGGATQLTAHLEAQLIERTRSLTQALADLSKSTIDACRLQRRVCELEAKLAATCSPIHGIPCAAPQTSGSETQDMIKESEDARRLVDEIKKLIRN